MNIPLAVIVHGRPVLAGECDQGDVVIQTGSNLGGRRSISAPVAASALQPKTLATVDGQVFPTRWSVRSPKSSTTTNTLERQKQVAFSNSIFIIGTRLITAKDSSIKDFADLKGRNVATTAGTTSDRLLNKFNDDKQMGINIMAVKENGQAFLAVESGRAVAFMMDDAILFGERAKSKEPTRWSVVGTPLSREAYGCMMKKDDAPFKKIVDATLAELMTSGQIKPIYQKWFEKPIPPRNLLLGFAASDDVSKLWAKPNDQSIE